MHQANAHGDANRLFAQRHLQITGDIEQTFGNDQRFVVADFRQYDGKFFASHAPEHILRAQGIAQALTESTEQGIATGVAKAVVYTLEVIEVQHQHGCAGAIVGATLQHALALTQKSAAGQNIGQIVEVHSSVQALQQFVANRIAAGYGQRPQ